jgi:hypothetical protein
VSGVDDLVAFVRARLNEREALLLHTRASDISCPIPISTLLAEVEAKRHILDDYDTLVSAIRRVDDVEGNRLLYVRREARESDIRWLAQPYAGQDGWREEWRA